jgi:hypothetical protein
MGTSQEVEGKEGENGERESKWRSIVSQKMLI